MSVCRFWRWPAWPCPCQRCLKSSGPYEPYELYDSVDSDPVDSLSGGSGTPDLAHLWQKPPPNVSPQSLLPWIRHCSNRLLGFSMDRHTEEFLEIMFLYSTVFSIKLCELCGLKLYQISLHFLVVADEWLHDIVSGEMLRQWCEIENCGHSRTLGWNVLLFYYFNLSLRIYKYF